MTIFDRIRLRRQELGLSQEELAKRLGLKSRAAVSAVEKGKCDMTTARIKRYADALETTPGYLTGEDDPLSYANILKAMEDPDIIAQGKLVVASFGTGKSMAAIYMLLEMLNKEGKEEAVRRLEELTELKKYRKED